MSGATYRRATPGDEHAIRSALPVAASTRTGLGADLARSDRIGVLAEVGVEVVGIVLLRIGPDHGHVLDVAVHPDHRRQGIATEMLQLAHRAAREAGVTHVTLEVRPSNTSARALYGDLGYVEAGVKPEVFNDPRDGADEDGIMAWWPAIPDGIPRGPVPLPTTQEA